MSEIQIPEGKILIETIALEEIVVQLEEAQKLQIEYKHDIEELYKNIMKLLSILGLCTPDGMQIKPEIINKEKNPISGLIKEGGKIFILMQTAKISKSAQEELNEKFSFFDDALPLLIKYGNYGKNSINKP